jgi:hypothetical protein
MLARLTQESDELTREMGVEFYKNFKNFFFIHFYEIIFLN